MIFDIYSQVLLGRPGARLRQLRAAPEGGQCGLRQEDWADEHMKQGMRLIEPAAEAVFGLGVGIKNDVS